MADVLNLGMRRKIASAISNYCSHTGEPDAGDALDVWCPDCRKIARDVIDVVEAGLQKAQPE